ncbi:MAG: acriflavin resistance protein [Bradyrhizobium sp.]|nr:acriflavin resistance protein [Bradyrhizobium sp.]
MSALSGVAAALAVAIVLSVYFRSGYRSPRDLVKHGLAAGLVVALVAFVVYDMRHAALAYLGINPTKPAVEFEIRMPKAALTAIADTQVELLTDRNQKLAKVQDALASTSDGRSLLKGTVTLDYRTTERVVVLNLPGQAQTQFKLRLPASPSHSQAFSPWHLADGITPAKSDTVTSETHDAFAIRYRVL